MGNFFGSKTIITGLCMIIAGVGAGGLALLGVPISGIDTSAALLMIGNGFGLVFMRQAISKVGP